MRRKLRDETRAILQSDAPADLTGGDFRGHNRGRLEIRFLECMARAAARQVTLAAFRHAEAADDLKIVFAGDDECRRAAAEIYAANIHDESVQNECIGNLEKLFEDPSKEIRDTAADWFHGRHGLGPTGNAPCSRSSSKAKRLEMETFIASCTSQKPRKGCLPKFSVSQIGPWNCLSTTRHLRTLFGFPIICRVWFCAFTSSPRTQRQGEVPRHVGSDDRIRVGRSIFRNQQGRSRRVEAG